MGSSNIDHLFINIPVSKKKPNAKKQGSIACRAVCVWRARRRRTRRGKHEEEEEEEESESRLPVHAQLDHLGLSQHALFCRSNCRPNRTSPSRHQWSYTCAQRHHAEPPCKFIPCGGGEVNVRSIHKTSQHCGRDLTSCLTISRRPLLVG